MKKRCITFFLALVVAAVLYTPAGAVSVRIDGGAERRAVLIEGTTYVPLRETAGLLCPGAALSWDGGQAGLSASGVSLTARPGDLYIQVNGRYLYAAAGVRLIDSRVYVPVRALAKALGASVAWDGGTQTAEVTPGSGALTPGDGFYDSEQVYWLSRIISAESAGEPMRGKIAVGNVILNRVASGDYPDSIYGVIFDRRFGVQFEPTLNGSVYQAPDADSVVAAKLCLDGASAVGGCRFFFNPDLAESTWIAQNCVYYCTIGRHLFYL